MKNKVQMEQSPYYVERDEKTQTGKRKSVRTDVSPEVYQDIEKYIMQRDIHYFRQTNEHFDRSKFVKELVMDFLNNHAIEQKFFKSLNAILLLPKTSNPDELNEKAQVIGFVKGDDITEITLLNIFHGVVDYPLTHNFIYTLKDFNEYNYKGFLHYFNVLYKYDENIFFNIDKETQQDFDKVKSRLSELYEDIDIDDAYFVMFTLNNYLDVLKDGVYRSESSDLEHEGVIILLEDFYQGVFAHIKWSYIQHELSFSLQFDDVMNFEIEIKPRLSNPEILQDFKSITKSVSMKEKLILQRELVSKEVNYLEGKFEELKRLLKELDEDISQYDEDNS